MIRISDISMPLHYTDEALRRAAAKKLRTDAQKLKKLALVKRSVDARKRQDVRFVVTVDVETDGNEDKLLSRVRDSHVTKAPKRTYAIPPHGTLSQRPVVVGFGPAGMFAGLLLARAGLRPIILERGGSVEERQAAVNTFWQMRKLNPSCNVQFGEGGAGTFSDGKLNTGTKDERIFFVLQTLCEHGAPEDILFDAKPHVGTDKLPQTVRAIREEIKSLGGEVRFNAQMTDLLVKNNAVCGVVAEKNGVNETIETAHVILAVGHSARDTFKMLFEKSCVPMEPKPFSVGARIEHRAETIDRAQYGDFAGDPALGTADYKLNVHLENGRGVYTFCMCPGGQVVCAASEAGGVVVNGMSRFARDGENANSALLVGVGPEDFGSDHPLAGVELQRRMERAAYEAAVAAGGAPYAAPAQMVGDFLAGRAGGPSAAVRPTYARGVAWCDLRDCLPPFAADALARALPLLDAKLHGFADEGAVMTGVETRSSSPVRIVRNEGLQAVMSGATAGGRDGGSGLYPCGEGAGYAGGIMSAACDGLRVAQAVTGDVAR